MPEETVLHTTPTNGQSQTQVRSHALVLEPQAMIRSLSSPALGAVMMRQHQLHKPHLQRCQATPPPTPQVIAGAPAEDDLPPATHPFPPTPLRIGPHAHPHVPAGVVALVGAGTGTAVTPGLDLALAGGLTPVHDSAVEELVRGDDTTGLGLIPQIGVETETVKETETGTGGDGTQAADEPGLARVLIRVIVTGVGAAAQHTGGAGASVKAPPTHLLLAAAFPPLPILLRLHLQTN